MSNVGFRKFAINSDFMVQDQICLFHVSNVDKTEAFVLSFVFFTEQTALADLSMRGPIPSTDVIRCSLVVLGFASRCSPNMSKMHYKHLKECNSLNKLCLKTFREL